MPCQCDVFGSGNGTHILIWAICAPSSPAQIASSENAVFRATRTEAALGIFDIARHYAFTLFARSRLYGANPPAPVIGEVRFVILRRTAFPLRVSKPCAPRLTRVSPRPARTGFASSSLSSLIAASRPMSRLHRMNREYHMSSPAHLRASRHGINPFWTAS